MTNLTALVTGASDGIGFEFCKVLAANQYDIVLVARREDKLKKAAEQLINKYSVACHVIPCDLSKPQAAQSLYKATQQKNITIDFLINNAGLLFNGSFHDIELQKQEKLLAVNITALTALSHLYAQDMINKGQGNILNVASTASWIGIPNQNIYSASKAYVLPFSLALAHEMKSKKTGVTVCCVCPNYTQTKMLNNPEQGKGINVPNFMILSPEFVAKEGIKMCLSGKPLSIPGKMNSFFMAVVQCFPKTWVTRIFGKAYQNM